MNEEGMGGGERRRRAEGRGEEGVRGERGEIKGKRGEILGVGKEAGGGRGGEERAGEN